MKLVKCKSSNRFLIKDEWYHFSFCDEVIDKSGFVYISYKLINHTDKIWNTTWYHESNFYSLDEIRDMKLNQILQKENFL